MGAAASGPHLVVVVVPGLEAGLYKFRCGFLEGLALHQRKKPHPLMKHYRQLEIELGGFRLRLGFSLSAETVFGFLGFFFAFSAMGPPLLIDRIGH